MKDKILVIGASGMLGEPVARKLHADGYQVRALSRNPHRLARQLGDGFEVVAGDVMDEASLRAAMAGCAGVHVNLMGGPSEADYDRVERGGTARAAAVAAELGVDRLTYLSGAPVDEANFRDPATKAKFLAEEAIRKSGVAYTIFRVTWMMEALPLFIRGEHGVIVGRQAHPVRWIAADDYARMVSAAFARPDTANKTYFVVGPEAVDKHQALQTYCETVRPEVKVRRVPVWLMRAVAALSFDRQLRSDIARMAFYDTIGDGYGDPAESDARFGPATTTLAEWCHRQRRPSPDATASNSSQSRESTTRTERRAVRG